MLVHAAMERSRKRLPAVLLPLTNSQILPHHAVNAHYYPYCNGLVLLSPFVLTLLCTAVPGTLLTNEIPQLAVIYLVPGSFRIN